MRFIFNALLLSILFLMACNQEEEHSKKVVNRLKIYKNEKLGLCFAVTPDTRGGYLAHVPCPGENKEESPKVCPPQNRCQLCKTKAAVTAVLESVDRLLKAKGDKKESRLAIIRFLRLTAEEAELEAKLKER